MPTLGGSWRNLWFQKLEQKEEGAVVAVVPPQSPARPREAGEYQYGFYTEHVSVLGKPQKRLGGNPRKEVLRGKQDKTQPCHVRRECI